jgi:hypothetical protein
MVKHIDSNYNQQPSKKKVGPFGLMIITFFALSKPYKHGHESQHGSLENHVFYICKRYRPFSHM